MRWRVKEYLEDKMAETQIEWTDSTWNPVAGCSIVTAGCTNCYAMEMARRLEAMGIAKYAGLTRKTGKRTVWNGVVREDREALAIPYGWKKPRKIFVNSMSDLFHEGCDPQAVFAKDGLFDELKKALAERVLNAEIDFRPSGRRGGGGEAQQPQRLFGRRGC